MSLSHSTGGPDVPQPKLSGMLSRLAIVAILATVPALTPIPERDAVERFARFPDEEVDSRKRSKPRGVGESRAA